MEMLWNISTEGQVIEIENCFGLDVNMRSDLAFMIFGKVLGLVWSLVSFGDTCKRQGLRSCSSTSLMLEIARVHSGMDLDCG